MSSVLSNRSFRGHVGAQYFGAFNDNLFKQLILFLAARVLFPGEDQQGLAFAVFSLPFILFSGVAGDLSERLSKRRIIVAMKWAELGIMLLGALALQLQSWPFMLVVLFVMGAQSAFFGPAKYGVIPELVEPRQLLSANGLITMTTFLAILTGQALAGPLLDGFGDQLWITGAVCTLFAAVGIGFATRIRPLEAVAPATPIHLNPFSGILASIRELRADDARVVPMLIMNSLFWFNGGVLQQAVTGIADAEGLAIPLDQNWKISLLLVTLAVSIIAGSVAVPLIARRVARGRLIIIGAVAMVAMQLAVAAVVSLLGGSSAAYLMTHVALAVLGFTGAFFAVPVQTFLQSAPSEGARGKAFAVNNFLNFTFIFLGGVWYLVLVGTLSLPPGWVSAGAGLVQLAVVYHYRAAALAVRAEGSEPAAEA